MYPIDKHWYTDEPEIIEVYDLWEIPKEMLLGRVCQFGIPTEFYIKNAQAVTPIQGRYWEVNRWYYENKIVDYDFLHALPDFKGSGNYMQLYLIEIWEDEGDADDLGFIIDKLRDISLSEPLI